jgi:glutamyl-tRNA reductase
MEKPRLQSGEVPTTQRVPEDELTNDFVDGAEEMVGEELEHTKGGNSRNFSHTIIALGQRLEQIRSAELERYRSKLGRLTSAQREAVDDLTRGILNKILHGPVCELKAHAGAPEQPVLAQLVRRIFGVA